MPALYTRGDKPKTHRVTTARRNKNINNAETQNNKLKQEVAELKRQAADTAEQHRRRDLNLANQINQLKDELKAAKKAIKQQNETLEKANSQNETIANECESLRIELQNNNKDYQQLRNEYNLAIAQIDELKQANAVLEQTIDAHKAGMTEAQVAQHTDGQIQGKCHDDITAGGNQKALCGAVKHTLIIEKGNKL